jgi:hypothetical protein
VSGPSRTVEYRGTEGERRAAFQRDAADAARYGWQPVHQESDRHALRVTYIQTMVSKWATSQVPAPLASPPKPTSNPLPPAGVARRVNPRDNTAALAILLAVLIGGVFVVFLLSQQRSPTGNSALDEFLDRTPRPTPAPGCFTVSSAVLERISQGLIPGVTLRNGKAVRSGDYRRVWFVAAEIDGPGIEGSGDVGVWATNSLTEGGLTFAVGGMAHQFSDWGHGEDTDAAMSISSDGYREAERCAGG